MSADPRSQHPEKKIGRVVQKPDQWIRELIEPDHGKSSGEDYIFSPLNSEILGCLFPQHNVQESD
jgi:hypothetical protein